MQSNSSDFTTKHFRHIVLITGSIGILLSCFLNWISITGRGYSLFELGEFAGTWGQYDTLKYLKLLGAAYFLIPIFGCLILMTLLFRKTSRIIAFLGGLYAMVLTGILFLKKLTFGLPAVSDSMGIYVAFLSALILFFGSIFSLKRLEE